MPRGLFVVLASVALATAGCGRKAVTRVSADEAVLERQHEGLRSLVVAAEKRPLVPFEQVLVVVDQGLVQELLSAATPFERVVASRYRVTVTRATVTFEDGFALVRLDGRASLADRPEAAVHADVSVFGALDVVDLDATSGVLRGRISVVAFDARRVDVMGVSAKMAEALVEELGRERLEAFGVLASGVEIPVALEGEVGIPGLGPAGGVSIAAARLPLKVAIRDVKALRGKLWICVGVESAHTDRPS